MNNNDFESYANQIDGQENGIPVSSNGVYDYPYQNVIVPTEGNITMQNVDYPILGISMETGQRQMMLPGDNYNFENTQNVLEIPQFQNGGKIKTSMDRAYDVKDIKNFMQSMVSSPWYKERIENNGYDPNWVDPSLARSKYYNPTEAELNKVSDNVVKQRLNNLNAIKFEEGHTPQGSAYVQRTNTVVLDGGQANSLKAHPRSIVTHELSHGSRKRGYENSMLSKYEQGLIHSKLINKEIQSHVNDPEEAKSDMDTIRYNLYKAKKFDPKTGRYETPDGKFNPSLLNTIKNDYNTKRMRKAYGDSSLSFLMNTIAQNDNSTSEDGLFYAQNGGRISGAPIEPVTIRNLGRYNIGVDGVENTMQLEDYENPGSSTIKNFDDYVLNQYRGWGEIDDFSIVRDGQEYIPSKEYGKDERGNYVDMNMDSFFPNGDNFQNRTYIPDNIQDQISLQDVYQRTAVSGNNPSLVNITDADLESQRAFMKQYVGSDAYKSKLSNYYPDARREQQDRLTRLGAVDTKIVPQIELEALSMAGVEGMSNRYADHYGNRMINNTEWFDKNYGNKNYLSADKANELEKSGALTSKFNLVQDIVEMSKDGVDNKSIYFSNQGHEPAIGIHEMSHYMKQVPRNQYEDILSRTKNTDLPDKVLTLEDGRGVPTDYLRTPTEVTSRLDVLRYLMKQEGIKDTTKDLNFTEKDLEKALQNPRIKNNYNVRNLIDISKGSQELLWLLNNIVDNRKLPTDNTQYMG